MLAKCLTELRTYAGLNQMDEHDQYGLEMFCVGSSAFSGAGLLLLPFNYFEVGLFFITPS